MAVWEISSRCKELRCVSEERRARSGGERIDGWLEEVEVVRSGEGWPERERRISCSMVVRFCSKYNPSALNCLEWGKR